MQLTSEAIVSMIQVSVADAYDGADTLTVGEDPGSGEVVICPPMSGPAADIWAISVRPGLAPLRIEVLGALPLEDPRFQRAVGDTLDAWVLQCELLEDRELAILDQLRIRDDDIEPVDIAA